MFVLAQLRQWFSRLLASSPPGPLEPERMSLRDWADLPPHHPLCDRAP